MAKNSPIYKRNKIPRNTFNQGSERPIIWNYKTLLKEIEEDTKKKKKGKIFCAHELEELTLSSVHVA